MATIPVRSSSGKYSVAIRSGLLPEVARHSAVAGRQCFVVTTARVLGLHGEKLLGRFPRRARPVVLLVAEGEQHKRLATVERLACELAAVGARRDAVLLAFGGGMIGDVTGFLASIYQRGVDCVQIPTTLLAQVDASVGGKTGVNLPNGKNLLGSFYPPRAVIADIRTLQTLSDRQFRAGLFECVKCAIMRNRKLFVFMETHRSAILRRDPIQVEKVVEQSVRIKASIVARDERESGERMLLNFGHTFGHALEAALGYRKLLHGEAVGWGMLAALSLSARLGGLSTSDSARVAALIRAYGPLPGFTAIEADVLTAMTGDKKRTAHGAQFVLTNAIGSGFVARGIPEREARSAVRELLEEARQT